MNESKKKVSIVTVNFNQPKVTEELLQSIAVHNTYHDIELIVVDNGSKDDPVPAWRQQYPSVQFIRNQVNAGFAGGNNLGIRAATGEYLFLVNNDTEFTTMLVETLVETMECYPSIGMLSPKIRYFQQPDMIQYAGFTPMNYYTARNSCVGQFEIDKGQYDDIVAPTGYIHGAAMMIRGSAMEKTGLMNENYFLYYEEMDWCEAFKRNGYETWINAKALIYHKESVSVGQKTALKEYFMNRNRLLFIRRNARWYQRWFFYVYFMAIVAPRNIMMYLREGRAGFSKELIKAIWWNITNAPDSTKLGWTFKK